MWSYYGRKTKVVKYYPEPKYNIIIEPFAGSAVYSLYKDNWKNKVILVDKYDIIIYLWRYLQIVNPNKIDELNNFKLRQDIRELTIDQELKWLLGFIMNQGSAVPKRSIQKWGIRDWERNKKSVLNSLHKIKHWDLILGEYDSINNVEATWFIDPPYQYGNKYYKHKYIDYNKLREWIYNLKGQVIVCENIKADWLDFKPLKEMHGQLHKTTEAIWYKDI